MGVSVSGIIMAVIGIFIAAVLLPPALVEIYGANTSGWSASVITVWQTLFPVLVVLGVAVAVFLGLMKRR